MSSSIKSVDLISPSAKGAIEVLRKDIVSYEDLKKSGKKCLTTNNEECCFVHYPEIKEALLAFTSVEVLRAENTALREKQERLKSILIEKRNIYSKTAKDCLDSNGAFKVNTETKSFNTCYYRMVGKIELIGEVLGELK